jgi:hypothetical protein
MGHESDDGDRSGHDDTAVCHHDHLGLRLKGTHKHAVELVAYSLSMLPCF